MGVASIIFKFLPLLLLILAGFGLGRIVGIDHRGLNAVILFAAVPCLMIKHIYSEEGIPWRLLPGILLVLGLVVLLSLLVLRLLSPLVEKPGVKWKDGRVKAMAPAVIFMSYAYTSLPFAEELMGQTGLEIGILIYICGALLAYTLGVYLLSGGGSLRPIFRLPLIYAIAIGLLLRMLRDHFQLVLPKPIIDTVVSIGNVASPLILLVVGLQMSNSQIRELRFGIGGGLMRICLGGLLGFGVTQVVGSIPFVHLSSNATVLLCMTCMLPSAAINAILAEHFRKENEIVESVVVASYILFAFFGTFLVAILFS